MSSYLHLVKHIARNFKEVEKERRIKKSLKRMASKC
jgi:hypothetical protein